MRQLATIQQIKSIEPIENSDFLELAHVMGWQCVVKKSEFQPGDWGVYFEVDSFLPMDERYEFLRKTSYRKNEFMGEGYRIKTMTMRGALSQGLFLPLSSFPELSGADRAAGEDVTEALNIRKWELPEAVSSGSGTMTGPKPHGIPTTDESRIQSNEQYLNTICGNAYYITTKMDGTSCTMYYKDGEFGVCGRNFAYADDDESAMWKYAHKFGLCEKMKELGRNIAVQGEFCGEGIQKNRLKLFEPVLYVFDVVDLDTLRYVSLGEMAEIADKLGLQRVPLEEEGESFGYSLDELLELAKGKYKSGKNKEGIVVRSKENIGPYNSRISFKVLNNDFLLKEEE
ncbi:MAG: RNA ligase (ATP) [Oscillospiraceae bacterium]|nr:RNA ligase (ATP) [Oscillospiraceae bacterium]